MRGCWGGGRQMVGSRRLVARCLGQTIPYVSALGWFPTILAWPGFTWASFGRSLLWISFRLVQEPHVGSGVLLACW